MAARYAPDTVRDLIPVLSPEAVTATTASGQTALHLAVVSRSPQAFLTLLNAGAQPGAVDRQGQTPLALAVALHEEAWVERILSAPQFPRGRVDSR